MIYHIKGKIRGKPPGRCLLGINLGESEIVLEINVPETSFSKLGEINEIDDLFIYPVFNEKKQVLYGFKSEEDRNLFETLVKLPNIGASIAFKLLSGMSADEIFDALDREDIKSIASIKGIGIKRAERLVFELRTKLPEIKKHHLSGYREEIEGAISALTRLGFRDREAHEIVKKVVSMFKDRELTTEEIIKEALRIGTRTE